MSPFHRGSQGRGLKRSCFGAGSSVLPTAAGASVRSGNTLLPVSRKIGGHFAARKIVDLSLSCCFFRLILFSFVQICSCFSLLNVLYVFIDIQYGCFEMYKLISNCENHSCSWLRLVGKNLTFTNCSTKRNRQNVC